MTWLSRAGRRGCVSMYKHPICAVWVVCVRLNFQQRYLFLHSHWFCTTDFTLRLLAKWNSWAKVLDVQAYHPDIKYISGNRFYLLFFCAFFLSFLEKGQSEACVCYGIQQTFVGFLNVIVKVWVGGGGRKSSLCAPPCDINARSRTIRSVCFSERRFRSKQSVLPKDAPGVFNREKNDRGKGDPENWYL